MTGSTAAIADEGALTDEALVECIRQGDRGSFDVLYDRYLKRIYSFVNRRLNNRADAEETVQEVFVNVFSSLDGFRGEAPFAAWLFGLTRRTIAARFKRKRHETVPLGDGDADDAIFGVSSDPDPLQIYEYGERLDRMEDAIQRDLTREQWQLFQLHHLQHQSIQEIARSVDKSEDAVKSHLYRARKVLLAG